jgi:hypothetical protein
MLEEIFRCPAGTYSEKNRFLSSWRLGDLIESLPAEKREAFTKRTDALKQVYARMSDIYQKARPRGEGQRSR